MRLFFILLVIPSLSLGQGLIMNPPAACHETISIDGVDPSERVDGSALDQLDGYNIRIDLEDGSYAELFYSQLFSAGAINLKNVIPDCGAGEIGITVQAVSGETGSGLTAASGTLKGSVGRIPRYLDGLPCDVFEHDLSAVDKSKKLRVSSQWRYQPFEDQEGFCDADANSTYPCQKVLHVLFINEETKYPLIGWRLSQRHRFITEFEGGISDGDLCKFDLLSELGE